VVETVRYEKRSFVAPGLAASRRLSAGVKLDSGGTGAPEAPK
jgi:hypothetical protein